MSAPDPAVQMPASAVRPVLLCLAASLLASGAARAAGAADAELAASVPASVVGAASAWSRGDTGAGVVVGVLDSGVRATHVELAGRVLAGFDAVYGGIVVGDALGHGTHVAALIAGARDGRGTVGIAPGATILPVRVFTDAGATDATLSAGVRWAAERSAILNLSLAAAAPIAAGAIRDAVAGGTLVVVAAGNRGAANPDWPARFARESWANGPAVPGATIAVGALGPDGRIAPFSNRAGDTAAWFLVAPGVDVLSAGASSVDASARLSGTSMAAPAVSGAAALLRAQWPRLSGYEVASILLATARDLGAPGTDPVYGRGLLDVDAAMRPVGTLVTEGAAGPVALSGTGMRLSPATVALAQAAARGTFQVVALDAYRRDFRSDLSSRLLAPLPQQVTRALDGIDRRLDRVERALPGGSRLAVLAGDSFSLVGRDGAGEFAFGAGARAQEWFGVAAGTDLAALGNPYASLGPRGALAGRGVTLGETTLRAGVLGGTSTENTGGGWTFVDARTTLLEARRGLGDTLTVTATFTRTVEQGAWLGAIGSGALASADAVRTDALQLGAAWRIAPGASLAGSLAQGRTPGHRGAGVIGTVGDSRSDAASVALMLSGVAIPDDGVSIALSQPMRTRSGDAVAFLQSGVDAAGAPVTSTQSVSLVPDGRERVIELGWRAPVGRDAAVGATFALRLQPNHDAAAAPDTVVALRYRLRF